MSEHFELEADTEPYVDTEPERCLYRYPAYCRHHPKYPDPFCGSRHPSKGNACRRIAGHDGDHSAYTFGPAVPETWPAVPVLVDVDCAVEDDDACDKQGDNHDL